MVIKKKKIRTKLLERGQIDAVIGLPAGIFTNTGIPTIIMILRKTSKHHNVLFIDASNDYRKDKNSNVLRDRDIKKILDAYQSRKSTAGYSHVASLDEIRANGYNLNIPCYVAPIKDNQSQSIKAHLKGGLPCNDIARFSSFWQAFDGLENTLFAPLRPSFVKLAVSCDEILPMIYQNEAYEHFASHLGEQITTWQARFSKSLLDTPLDEERYMACFARAEKELFEIFHKSAFTDAYEAYQALIDTWHELIDPGLLILADDDIPSNDKALIHENAFYKARLTVPNMVIKNKTEVQDGVEGLLFPKAFITGQFFADELAQIDALKGAISEIEERQAKRLANANDTALANYLNDKEKLYDKAYKTIA